MFTSTTQTYGARLLTSALFCFLFIISCNDDERSSENVQTLSGVKEFLSQQQADNNLLVNVERNGMEFTLIFEDGTRYPVRRYFIRDVRVSLSEWNAVIHLADGTEKVVGYVGDAGAIQVETTLNPYGTAPLSAAIDVTTPVDGKMEVKVRGKDGPEGAIERKFEYLGKNHHLEIFGLYSDYANTVDVTFTSREGVTRFTKTITIQTNPLPENFPEIIVDVAKPEKMEVGLTLVSYLAISDPCMPFIMDHSGEIRWYLDYTDHPELNKMRYDNGVERLLNGNLYFADSRTNTVYEVDLFGQVVNRWPFPGYVFHHQVLEKPDGNFLISVNKPGSTHLNGNPTVEDYVIEIDRTSGAVVKEWDLKQSLDEYRTAQIDNLSRSTIDWFHTNGLAYDASDNTIIVSGRTQGVVKLTYDNTPKWILGPHKGWGMSRDNIDLNQFLLNPVDQSNDLITDPDVLAGDTNHPDFEWNWYQHSPKVMPNGNILLFDNGDQRNFTGAEKYSRAVEFAIDESQMTVKQVWSYGKERGISTFSSIVSEVDYLPGKNNILFSPGSRVDNDGKQGGKIIEINYDTKEVVFEVRINAEATVTLHRAERLDLF